MSLRTLFQWVPHLFQSNPEAASHESGNNSNALIDDDESSELSSSSDSSDTGALLSLANGESHSTFSPHQELLSEPNSFKSSRTSSLLHSSSSSSSTSPLRSSPSSSPPRIKSLNAKRPRSHEISSSTSDSKRFRKNNSAWLTPETATSSLSCQSVASVSTRAYSELSLSSSLCFDDDAYLDHSTPIAPDTIELELPATPCSFSWKKTEIVSGAGPGPRCWTASCVFQQKLLVLGGYDLLTPYPQGLHVFDTTTESWLNYTLEYPASLPARYAHVLANVQDRLIVFGGDSLAGYRNDLFELTPDFSSILRLQALGTPPDPRAAPGHASIGSKLYISGGDSGNDRGYHNDLHVLHTNTLPFPTWERLQPQTPPPEPRGWHTLSAVHNKLYIFGGYNGNAFFGDIHVFDLATSEWSSPPARGKPPSPRHSHAAVVIADQYILIVGGVGSNGANYDSVHIFDTATLSWIEPFVGGAPLPQRHGHSLFYLPEMKQIYSFGGYDFTHLYDCFAILPLQHSFKITPSPGTLSADLKILVNNPAFSDIYFKFEDGSEIYAHRALLSARSEYFRAMFSSFAESHQKMISIIDVSSSIFLSVIEYLYTGTTPITSENVFPLLLAANMYNLSELSSVCQRTFESALSCSTAVSLFEFADNFYAPLLKQVVIQFIAQNTAVILDSDHFSLALPTTKTALLQSLATHAHSQSDQELISFVETKRKVS